MIPLDELRFEVWPPRQKGGQQVTMTSAGVMATHVPTETVAISMLARSQHKNRAIAIEMIEAALTHPWSK